MLVILTLLSLAFTSSSVVRDVAHLKGKFMSEAEVERHITDSIDPDDLREWSKNYTRKSHLAGQGKDLVDWTNDKFQEFGLISEIVPYYTYLNYPGKSSLSLVDKTSQFVIFEASLKEEVLKEDPTTGNADSVPAFHGYSANGTATAQYIYVNYGRKEDFDKIVSLGVDIKNKIVLVRYGKVFRGLKVKQAQEHGAVGVVIFTDPTDDYGVDFAHGDKPYPKGPARNPSSIQRGSVGFLSYGPGDPTTPGYASTKDAKRKQPYDLIPSIPSIPISYADAIPILQELNGKGPSPKDIDSSWGGILENVSYNVGPSDNLLELNNNQDYDIRPIHNVIGRIDGIIPGQAIVVGNHRDSWISGGAGDPNSGSAALLALAKALGELKKRGWRPLRTIILASWDGEEYALLGSTEWGEDNAKFLKHNVVAYVNLDMAVSGTYFSAGASPSLNEVLREVTKQVPYPAGGSVYQHWKARNNNRISTLGTGSDYTVFLDHLGIPSVDFSFRPGPGDPVYHYHSNYDSYHWMTTLDPDFKYHAAASRVLSLLTLSLADRVSLNFRFEEYGSILKSGLDKIVSEHKVGDLDRLSVTNHHNDNNNNRDRNRRDRPSYRCKARSPQEHLECLKESLERFTQAGKVLDDRTVQLTGLYAQPYPWYRFYKQISLLAKLQAHNYKMIYAERVFLINDGLDLRPWYKHVLFAPNRYLGYGGAVFPGILESLEDKDTVAFIKWTSICRGVLDGATHLLLR